MFDKVFKPELPRFTALYECHFLDKPKLCKNKRNKSNIFFKSNQKEIKWSVRVPNYTESLQNALDLFLTEV